MRDEDWADYVHIECPECREPVDSKCRNPISHLVAHSPCLKRIRAAAQKDAS